MSDEPWEKKVPSKGGKMSPAQVAKARARARAAGRPYPNLVDNMAAMKEGAEPHSTNMNKPSSRFDGSNELVAVYKKATPGQSKTLSTVKKVVRESLGDCGCDSCKCNEKKTVDEAEYQGRKVALGKPMKGDVKKSKVYVRNEKGTVVKVNFGDKNLSIKKNIPARRKSFRARHNCDNPGPRTKARYWSCRAW